jgi:hypothetical protein
MPALYPSILKIPLLPKAFKLVDKGSLTIQKLASSDTPESTDKKPAPAVTTSYIFWG